MTAISPTRVVASILAIYLTTTPVRGLAQEQKKESGGSVAGRVMLGDKPVVGATVMLTTPNRMPDQAPPARATTDEEGRFKLTGVPGGSYSVLPYTPTLVIGSEATYGQPGKSVTLSDGEEVDGIDFSLTKGGVITGRVTDGDGRPLVEQHVALMLIDDRGSRMPSSYFNPFSFSTDDRGVYRVYGLRPGRYKVSVGDAPESGIIRVGYAGGAYVRTFHPDVTEESSAEIVEVTAGGEATGIDIKLGRSIKTYTATGRIVDADTGKPLPNLQYGHGPVSPDQKRINGYGWTSNRTNDNGEFRIDGLAPGRHAAFVVNTEQVDFYSEPAVFEISESNVSGLEIKVRRGSSINGLAVIEGATDPDVLARISKLELYASIQSEDLMAPRIASIQISADGSFRVLGLRAGKVRISMGGYPPQKGFSLVRVERDGIPQREGIDVGPGESVSGIRLVIGYGTSVIRGQVTVKGGEPSPNVRFAVSARRMEDEPQGPMAGVIADARGRFTLEGMLPGDYEVSAVLVSGTPYSPGPGANRARAKQTVTVANGAETEITLLIDLGSKDK